MLGTMAGLWISIFLLVFGGIMVAAIALGKSAGDNAVKVKNNSVLVLDLAGNVEERYQPASFMAYIQNGENSAPTLEEMLTAVRSAANDNKIEGIYMKCGGSAMGTAAREELLEALKFFKESGKWIYAYSDSYAQGDYLLATVADSILLNPVGSVDIHGVGGMTPFFTGLLDKLGVKMQIIKVGTYKSAVEPYILKEMSAPARRQMQQYVDTIWSFVSGTIADNRAIPQVEIADMASNFISQSPAEVFVQKNLVTGLAYERTVDNAIRSQLGIDEDDDINFISASSYTKSETVKNSLLSSGHDHIAVLYAVGDIVDSGDGGIVGPDMV